MFIKIYLIIILTTVLFLTGVLLTTNTSKRFWYAILALSCLFIFPYPLFTAIPEIEMQIIPLNHYYAAIRSHIWLPFTILFWGALTHLVEKKNKRGIKIMLFISFVLTIQQSHWLLSRSEIYSYKGEDRNGYILQSSDYTCGAASAVNFLKIIGVDSTEGEMARLAMVTPETLFGAQPGTDFFLLACGVAKKLENENLKKEITVKKLNFQQLLLLDTPMLAERKFYVSGKIWIRHAVVLIKITDTYVHFIDPIYGRMKWSLEKFMKNWTGTTIYFIPV